MELTAHTFNDNRRILISRNAPIAFLVGVAGFIGSALAEELLKRNVQVIGIDDFSEGEKKNLQEVVKNKNFHFIQENIADINLISKLGYLNLPRLDYAFFTADKENPEAIFTTGILNFLHLVSNIRGSKLSGENEKTEHDKSTSHIHSSKPRIVLVSSTDLYNNSLEYNRKILKECEIKFAKFVKYYKLNARIVRLATVFGPRMHFREKDPVVRLIQASLKDELQKELMDQDFSSRAIFIDDAIELLIKSVLVGSTSQKIYDGALYQPIKVSEIKQVLLDPLWFEEKKFTPTELPPWPTPNLERTIDELHWKPRNQLVEALRKTIIYFKEHNVQIPELSKAPKFDTSNRWSFSNPEIYSDEKKTPEKNENITPKKASSQRNFRVKKTLSALVLIAIIMLGLVYPIGSLAVGGLTVRYHLKNSKAALEEGDFNKAKAEINQTKISLGNTADIIKTLILFKRLGLFRDQIQDFEQINGIIEEGVEGVEHAISGSESLFKTTKIISGEDKGDPAPYYDIAQKELTVASQKISKVSARLGDSKLQDRFPNLIKIRIQDLKSRLDLYQDLVDKARVASILMPEITGINSKKSYLVIIQNNLELRPTGGFIGSYAKLDFENGRIAGIKVDDVYNLDGGLQDIIEPPQELKSDMGIQRLFLRDSNFDPDFPTSARQASFLFKRESGSFIHGVIAIDMTASGKLISSVGGLDLPEYGEHVDSENLFEKLIAHSETGFFPGSQAKKNYLVSLQTQLFNKVFYLSKQNWPEIIASLGSSLEQKNILVYVEDPKVFSYLVSANWSGVMPRGTKSKVGETNDFLAVNEANVGANKVNYFLKRSSKLETKINEVGEVSHKLSITYSNNSPSDAFPGGKYKNRIRIYLPLGAKLQKSSFGEADLTAKFSNFSDYGRTGYSVLIEVMPQETKILTLDYTLAEGLNLKDNLTTYTLDVVKQPGTQADPFEWDLSLDRQFDLENTSLDSNNSKYGISVVTNLAQDRTIKATLKKK